MVPGETCHSLIAPIAFAVAIAVPVAVAMEHYAGLPGSNSPLSRTKVNNISTRKFIAAEGNSAR